MGGDLFAALRTGVEDSSVPQPISGESINDFRFRAAHAGAIIGIKWVQERAIAEAEAAAEAEFYANLDASVGDVPPVMRDATGQGWRHGDSTVAPPIVHQYIGVPPEQNEAAGV
jgi:hypothetical protein